MLRFLRRHFIEITQKKRNPEPQSRRAFRNQGQVGLILILLAALGLVFYAMSLNLYKVSSAKSQTMIAAEKSASFMASFMASYAQKLSEENLQGGLQYCKSTSLFSAIMKTVILIVVAVICTIVPGLQGVAVMLWIAVAMSAGATILNAVYIQPTLTSMWNKMMTDTLSSEGQLVEYGIQYALRGIVNDQVKFPDFLDSDMDGVFVTYNPNVPSVTGQDSVSRFNYYYTQRLLGVEILEMDPVVEFAEQLADFVEYFDDEQELRWVVDPLNSSAHILEADAADDDVWGLHDSPINLNDSFVHPCETCLTTPGACPAECDPSCVPNAPVPISGSTTCCDVLGCPQGTSCTDPSTGNVVAWPDDISGANVPSCCGSCANPYDANLEPDPRCEFDYGRVSNSHCAATSYMGGKDQTDTTDNDYGLVYDPFYEDSTNNMAGGSAPKIILSLREIIGRDDLSPAHRTNRDAPDWHLYAHTNVNTQQTLKLGIPLVATSINDGTHDPDNRELIDYEARDATGFWQGDSQVGLFPFLYAMQDIGVDLSTVEANKAANSGEAVGKQCYWEAGACDLSGAPSRDMEYYEDPQKQDPRLYELTQDTTEGPLEDDETIVLNSTLYGSLTGDSRVIDLGSAGRPDIVRDPDGLFLPDDDCGDGDMGWKRGTDAFCSDPWKPNDSTHPENPNPFNYPYYMECPKNGFDPFSGGLYGTSSCSGSNGDPMDCFCGDPNARDAKYFTRDALDDFYYALPEFLSWAREVISRIDSDVTGPLMRQSVSEWYFDAAEWLEPKCSESCQPGSLDCCPESFTKKDHDGALFNLADQMKDFYEMFDDWIFPPSGNDYAGPSGTAQCHGTGAVWCVPPGNLPTNEHGLPECIGVTPDEAATFDVNGNNTSSPLRDADLEDVVACLDFNVNDTEILYNGDGDQIYIDNTTGDAGTSSSGAHVPKGNKDKFEACAAYCGPWACQFLPRSPVPLDNNYAWLENEIRTKLVNFWSDKELFRNCLSSKTYEDCSRRCTPVGENNLDGNPGVLPMVNNHTGGAAVAYCVDAANFVQPTLGDGVLGGSYGILDIQRQREEWEEDCADGTFDNPTIILSCSGYNTTINTCNLVSTQELKFSECINSYGGSCEAIVSGYPNAPSTGETDFYERASLLIDGVKTMAPDVPQLPCDPTDDDEADDGTGFCHESRDGDAAPDFTQWVEESAVYSENIVKKLAQRYRFLNYVKDQGLKARKAFGEATDRFHEFLDNNTAYNELPPEPSSFPSVPETDEAVLATGPDPDGNGQEYIFPDKERDVEWYREGRRVHQGTADEENVYKAYGVDSPAELLTQLAFEKNTGTGDLPSVAVYVWRGPKLYGDSVRSDGSQQGYLHAVKVEVRAPKRCNNACDPSGTEYQRWPWIKTWTENWGTKRCYGLKDYEGRVKARVIRYDEPVDTSNRVFRFANNVPIWGMSLSHPDTVGESSPQGLIAPGTACYGQIDPLIESIGKAVADVDGENNYLHHAFMLNRPPESNNPSCSSGSSSTDPVDMQCNYDLCWKQVHERLLAYGIYSESCARYVWEGSDMGVRFQPCDSAFSSGHR